MGNLVGLSSAITYWQIAFPRVTMLTISQVICVKDKYQLERQLGSGSFGEVYQGNKSPNDLIMGYLSVL